MKSVFVTADNIISPLGFTTDENFDAVMEGRSGIRLISDLNISRTPLYASIIDNDKLLERFNKIDKADDFTRLEQMLILSVADAVSSSNIDIRDDKTLIILSSTKGNIDLLETGSKKFPAQRATLWGTAELIKNYFRNPNRPVVISNACSSGVLAIIIASRLLGSMHYDSVVVTGGDIVSEFVVSGFQSFKAISDGQCRPFDASRTGITLGEGCGTVVLTKNPKKLSDGLRIVVAGGASSNDANHISGPSRTGEGLNIAISACMKEAGVTAEDVDYISAHGTATDYNDEMEAKAIVAAGLSAVPVNSLKGYFGHTLGASGIIESIIGIESLKNNILIKTMGYEKHGVSGDINIISETKKANLKNFMKIASGFGGCNAGAFFKKI